MDGVSYNCWHLKTEETQQFNTGVLVELRMTTFYFLPKAITFCPRTGAASIAKLLPNSESRETC